MFNDNPLDHGFGSKIYGTTILCIKKGDQTVIAGDGQVSMGSTILKANARKLRRLENGILAGFAGSTADAFTLFELLEAKLEKYSHNLLRSAVELAKDWRTSKNLRALEAMMIVANKECVLTLTGNGDVIEPEQHSGYTLAAIGSGGLYARSAATALAQNTELGAEEIVMKSMHIAASICVYSNHNIILEKI